MTAVEWLFNQLDLIKFAPREEWVSKRKQILIQAKAMEKEQHSNTWDDSRVEDKGDEYIGKQIRFDQYYNEKYGNKAADT